MVSSSVVKCVWQEKKVTSKLSLLLTAIVQLSGLASLFDTVFVDQISLDLSPSLLNAKMVIKTSFYKQKGFVMSKHTNDIALNDFEFTIRT